MFVPPMVDYKQLVFRYTKIKHKILKGYTNYECFEE
jgi:hypothetical protein